LIRKLLIPSCKRKKKSHGGVDEIA